MDNSGQFTARQRRILDTMTLPPYPSIAAAADKLRIPRSTAYKWRAIPAFRAELELRHQRQTQEAERQARAMLAELVPAALSVKAADLQSENATIRARASTWILQHLLGQPAQPVELSGPDGEPIALEASTRLNLEALSDDQLAALEALCAQSEPSAPIPGGSDENTGGGSGAPVAP